MQTFLPHADFRRSAEVLDVPRLGKQRVETLQVVRSLVLDDYGWATHPAVRMWRGHVPALVRYGLDVAEVWTRDGRADTTAEQVAEFAPEVVGRSQADLAADGLMPPWLGDDRLHRSHRSALVRKDPDRYRPLFGDVPDDLPYFWPEPPAPAVPLDEIGPRMWVLRAGSADTVEEFRRRGVVGLGTASGIDVDASAGDEATLRGLLKARSPGRRPGKELRVLAAFVEDVAEGDPVVVPDHERGEHLLLGEVTGGYRFSGSATTSVPHRRAVRWIGRLPREVVRPVALLQNPRTLFAVPAPDEDVLASAVRPAFT
ncbi:MAG: MSMEG_6728 family protein [Gordonia paraffinivorans]